MNPAFAYLLDRYDSNDDAVITATEYTRHDGQFARWDRDEDGRLTEEDWTEVASQISPQIMIMQRLDVLGRYFQTDENGAEILTIDELANAFFDYDESGTADDELSEAEFRAMIDERAIEMPGDGSMMMQSYVGEADGWERLTQFYDSDASQTLSMDELSAAFAGSDSYELRFDQARFDGSPPDERFERLAYESGLVVGSPVPDLELTALNGGPPVELARVADGRPMALIFGSYT